MAFKYILALFILLAFHGPGAAQRTDRQDQLNDFLRDHIGFSGNDIKAVEEGKIITKVLNSKIKHEVAVFSMVRVDVPKVFFVQNYGKEGLTIETAAAEMRGRFGTPPLAEDVLPLTLPPTDIVDLKLCKPKNCKIKLPVQAIVKFSRIDPSASDYDNQVNRLFRQGIMNYLHGYLENGNRALVEYDVTERPVRLAEEFHDLLQESRYVYEYIPELHRYLEKFPNAGLADARELFYWKKDDLGRRVKHKVITLNHGVIYQRRKAVPEIVVASKQLYATHYFDAALALTAMEDTKGDNASGFYLMHLKRARLDVLRKIPRFLKKTLTKGVRDILHKKMVTVKNNMETEYRGR